MVVRANAVHSLGDGNELHRDQLRSLMQQLEDRVLGVNPFDQFGVELGKAIARELADGADDADLDAWTRALIGRAGI